MLTVLSPPPQKKNCRKAETRTSSCIASWRKSAAKLREVERQHDLRSGFLWICIPFSYNILMLFHFGLQIWWNGSPGRRWVWLYTFFFFCFCFCFVFPIVAINNVSVADHKLGRGGSLTGCCSSHSFTTNVGTHRYRTALFWTMVEEAITINKFTVWSLLLFLTPFSLCLFKWLLDGQESVAGHCTVYHLHCTCILIV